MLDRQKLFWVYIYTFATTAHLALIIYIGSTFLAGIFGQGNIWIVYSFAAFLSLVLNFSITPILKKFELVKVNKIALYAAALNMLFLVFARDPIFIFLTYAIYIVLSEYLYMLSSVMVEDLSKNSQTGNIRGRYLSMMNMGYLIAPFTAFFLIKFFSIQAVFLASFLFVLICIFIAKYFIGHIPRIVPHELSWKNTVKDLWKNYDVRVSVLANCFFYIGGIAMVVYVPFKLASVGIDLTTYLSVILPVSLLAFVLIPQWLGHVEDKMQNEKELMIFSFFGIALSLCAIALIKSGSLLIWTGLIILLRIFGAIAETSINSYFFKKVSKTNTAVISIFSSSKQISYLIVTPILSVVLIYGNLEAVFLSVAFSMCFMLVLIGKLHGTENYEKHEGYKKIHKLIKRRI